MNNTNDRPYNAFLRLAVHLCDLRDTLRECSEVSAPEFDHDYVVEQVSQEINTLQVLAQTAGEYWNDIQHDIAKAAGSLNLDRPDDDVSWCHTIVNTAWATWNKLSRQCQSDPADRIRVYALLADTLHSFEERDVWKNRIAKEFRAMAATARKPKESQNKTGEISDDDRTNIQDAIDSYRAAYNGADPTSEAIRQRSGLGPNKISQIMAERRADGLWAVPVRGVSKKK